LNRKAENKVDQKGYSLLIVIFWLFILTATALSLIENTTILQQIVYSEYNILYLQYITESGIDLGKHLLKNDKNFRGIYTTTIDNLPLQIEIKTVNSTEVKIISKGIISSERRKAIEAIINLDTFVIIDWKEIAYD